MPTIDDVFGGNSHLKAGDLKGRNVELVIESVEVVDFTEKDGKEKKKPILHFKGKKKDLVCNVTNARMIADMHGPEMDDWVGKTIILRPDKTSFGDQIVDCIRVGMPAKDVNDDDDIPF